MFDLRTNYIETYTAAAEAAVVTYDLRDTDAAEIAADCALSAVRRALNMVPAFLSKSTMEEVNTQAVNALLDLREALDDAVLYGEAQTAVHLLYAVYEMSYFDKKFAVPEAIRICPFTGALVPA